MIFAFSDDVFKKQYARIFNILQNAFVLGFILFFIVVLIGVLDIDITIMDGLNTLVAAYLVISVFGFPIIYFVKKGQKRLLEGSKISIDKDGIIVFERLTEQLWTILGHIKEYKIYKLVSVESVTQNNWYYIFYGKIEYKRIYNGKVVYVGNVTSVKIPIAYENMEKMKECCEK